MILHDGLDLSKLSDVQSSVVRERHDWIKPELGLAVLSDDVDMRPGLFPGKEEEPVGTFSMNGWAHGLENTLLVSLGG